MQRRMSVIKEYKFFRSFSTKIENWSIRRAEAIWRKLRERKLAEIEALEACNWLRAAGFPQYASMFQENLFPIDLSTVARDHPFLENDPLQSLYRRLVVLNKCAKIRVDFQKKSFISVDDESDDENFALSENWTFEPQIRRWSRVVEMGPINMTVPHIDMNSDSSTDSQELSPEKNDLSAIELLGFSTLPLGLAAHPSGTDHGISNKFKRSGSERLKIGAKALLKKVESIKVKKRRHKNEDIVWNISQINKTHTTSRPSNLTYTKSSSNPTSPFSSPIHPPNIHNSSFLSPVIQSKYKLREPSSINSKHHKNTRTMDDLLHCSDSSLESTSSRRVVYKNPSRVKRFLVQKEPDDQETLSDSECQIKKENKKCLQEKFLKKIENNLTIPAPIRRGGSLNLGKEPKLTGDGIKRKGFRSRSTVKTNKEQCETSTTVKEKVSNNRWHTFQKSNRRQSVVLSLSTDSQRRKSSISGFQMMAMSSGQLQVIKKLALVTLTGFMERYCPNHKSGWQHWELPKFIKKIKSPDYRDKRVFGVPILLTLQRTGQSLPLSIQGALKWLKLNAIESVGIFRKSGVKSRITKLKWLVEMSSDDSLSLYEGQHAYDVADMVKQYFRELPESILTSKLSDTFLTIFKHLPSNVHSDAVQSTLLLLPDENRDVLYYLLDFLKHISDGSIYNQMTPHNLSVCLAPSIFQSNKGIQKSTTCKVRNNETMDLSNQKELFEAHASHECLAFMIQHYKSLFSITSDRFSKCTFNYMDESEAVSINTLCDGNWNAYIYECTKATLKEGKERFFIT